MTGLTRIPIWIAIASAAAIVLMAFSVPARAGDPAPPDDLVRLERQVGLRVAHVRDEGPVGSEERKLYLEAQQDDANGEQALKARDYGHAMSYFKHANALLDQLGKVGE